MFAFVHFCSGPVLYIVHSKVLAESFAGGAMMKLKNMVPVALIAMLLSSGVAFAFTGNGLSESLAGVEKDELEMELENLVPETYEESLKIIEEAETNANSIYPRPFRFILWTNDGENVMWGRFGNGRFIGEDNNGGKAWGLYYNGLFIGFYENDGYTEPFIGKYWKRWYFGKWKAEGLFGLDESYGGLITFPAKTWVTKKPLSLRDEQNDKLVPMKFNKPKINGRPALLGD